MSGNLLEQVRGKPVVVRTVAYHYMGLLVDYDASHLALEQASWLATSGVRWAEFLVSGPGEGTEIEPYPPGVVLLRGRPAPSQPPCEGLFARWCPRCGACTCPAHEDGLFDPHRHRDCPLHGDASRHAEEG